MITLPTDFTTDLVANISTIFTDVSPLLLVALGIPFAVYAIKLVASFIPKAKHSSK
jgi:hypothetical protein